MKHPILCAAMSLSVFSVTPPANAGSEQVLTNRDTPDNIEVRLVAARISETRGQNLIARLAPLRGDGPELSIRFPSHSHTTHETTLMNVVYSCTAPRQELGHEWTTAVLEAVFSVPKDAQLRSNDLSHWYLVSIKARDRK